MRLWQLWWRALVFSTQYNPPEFVELIMVGLAIGLLGRWRFTPDWPYLVLSSSFAIGAAISMWIREQIVPSPHPRVGQMLAFLLIIYSLSIFAEIANYF
ncbi:MAG TPA: hypothetical protein V6C90_07595 [Coleofasciculaceae cyanobacterium]|jgi:hypothetical protein